MKPAKIILLICLFAFPVFHSCSPVGKQYRAEKKRHKQLEKDKEKKKKEAEKAFTEAMKRHYKMQSKDTQRAMKRGKKIAEGYNENRKQKEFFIKKWFTNRKKRNKEGTR